MLLVAVWFVYCGHPCDLSNFCGFSLFVCCFVGTHGSTEFSNPRRRIFELNSNICRGLIDFRTRAFFIAFFQIYLDNLPIKIISHNYKGILPSNTVLTFKNVLHRISAGIACILNLSLMQQIVKIAKMSGKNKVPI